MVRLLSSSEEFDLGFPPVHIINDITSLDSPVEFRAPSTLSFLENPSCERHGQFHCTATMDPNIRSLGTSLKRQFSWGKPLGPSYNHRFLDELLALLTALLEAIRLVRSTPFARR